ncbi:MAG: CD1871A family CXXC motif-containing protein [Eubacteriales bacterium]|nr:CD1871A family CXXC motif-containing protein [Eubacteriales bacterium]
MSRTKQIKLLQFGVFFTAVLMMFFGFRSGEADVMFRKAIYICMECIGLG